MALRIERNSRHTTRFGGTTVLTFALLALWVPVLGVMTSRAPGAAQEPSRPEPSRAKVGLLINESRACQGYTLLASSNSTYTYLIDMEGRVVQTWKSDCHPGHSAYLLENAHLLRTGQVRNQAFFGGGAGGRVQEFTWDGKLVWDYMCSSETQLQHHDICRLPNGNILINVWEKKSTQDATAAGRRPETVGTGHLMSAALLEVQPTGTTTGKVVWEWHAWDHIVQEFDANKAYYADVGAHPELIDLNFGSGTIAAMVAKPEELTKLRAIGYVGGAGRRAQRPPPDWLHINAVDYNANLDQVMLTVHEFNEIWVLDHGTTTAQAASHSGGRYGKGGDLLYRWGNPSAYRAGSLKDQKLFGPHSAHWIAKGLPGEGHVLIFNNGVRRIGGAYSTVDEIDPPVDARGCYESSKGKAFGPDRLFWSYVAPKRTDFFAPVISGAQRLPNGDTLICSGTNGTVFEVTPTGDVVWKYVNPTRGSPPMGGPRPGGPGGPPFGPPKLGQILPSFLQDALNLAAEQKKQLEAVEKDLGEKLVNMLTDEQKKRLEQGPIGFGPGSIPAPGQLLAPRVRDHLNLKEQQQKQLAELQKEADGKLDGILKDDQRKQFKEMQDFHRGFPGGPPPGGFPGGPPPGGPPGFGGPGGGGSLFRAPRYAPDFPGLAGKDLKGDKTIEELQADPPKDSLKVPTKSFR
jgi:hypothetical protein